MSRRKKSGGASNRGPGAIQVSEQLAEGIRVELRSIVRGLERLRRPFERFAPVESQPMDRPRHRVEGFSSHEEVHNQILALAGAVWHLKDRLSAWVKAKQLQISPSIEEIASQNPPLLICADLINTKKHGECKNRSGYEPRLTGVSLEMRNSGGLGLRYDGAMKEAEVLVTHCVPVSYRVEIESGDGRFTFGNAIDLIDKAFGCWRLAIAQLGILAAPDPESTRLVTLLYPPQ